MSQRTRCYHPPHQTHGSVDNPIARFVHMLHSWKLPSVRDLHIKSPPQHENIYIGMWLHRKSARHASPPSISDSVADCYSTHSAIECIWPMYVYGDIVVAMVWGLIPLCPQPTCRPPRVRGLQVGCGYLRSHPHLLFNDMYPNSCVLLWIKPSP